MANLHQPKSTRRLVALQTLMGIGAYAALGLPYLRKIHGLKNIDSNQHYLFVSNHVSLLDTIILGALCWRSGCYPILTLGDKGVWHTSRLKKMLSRHIGFLLDRGRMSPKRIQELQTFGRASSDFHLLVFPEGTRGNGIDVGPCKPGLHIIAREAQLPIVPVFIENMHRVSTKSGSFHPIGGLRKVEIHIGKPIDSDRYLALERDEFGEFIRRQITSVKPARSEAHSNPAQPHVEFPNP